MSKRWIIVLAFAAIYIVWGSTYLAIRYAIDTMPPLIMAGLRFLIAGTLMYAWARRTAPAPTAAEWRAGAIIGALLFLGGNGAVVLAEKTVPSGTAALLIAVEPLWVAMLDALRTRTRPDGLRVAGLLLGLGGVAILVGPTAGGPLGGMILILLGSLTWAAGSIYGLGAPRPRSPAMSAAVPMLTGGAILLAVGTVRGEWGGLSPAAFSTPSLLAFAYLIVFGSVVAFTAYSWLITNVSPTLVATYAFVNPVVAVFLGWALGGEVVTLRTVVGAAVIVSGVVLITVGPTLWSLARQARMAE